MNKIPVFLFCLFFGISLAYSQVPTKGLVLYLPMNGNALDASTFGNNGTAVNTTPVSDRFGKAGKALSFNGNSSYIRIPASTSLNLIFNKSSSCWIYLPSNASVNNYSSILFKDEPVNNNTYSMQMNQEAGYGVNRYKIGFAFTSSTTNYGASTKQLYTNFKDQWIHLAGTYDSISGKIKIYFNGVVSDSTTVGNISSNPSNLDLFIGCAKNNSYLSQTYFNGYLDDIRLYNRALSAKEVLSLYNEGMPVYSQDTTAYYVGSDNYKDIKTVTHLMKIDSLKAKISGVDSIARHFGRFEYKANSIQSVLVTDTLVIKVSFTGVSTVLSSENSIKIYPNPTKDFVCVNFGDVTNMQGYLLMIRDNQGKLVYITPVVQDIQKVNLSNWSGKGIYVVQLLDNKNNILNTKKLILK